jgi:hypothetical protein
MVQHFQAGLPATRRRNALRIVGVFSVIAVLSLSFAIRPHQPGQVTLIVLGVVSAVGAILSFWRFLQTADDLQKDIHREASNFAFVGSLLLTLLLGIAQRFGFLTNASLFVPAVMVALWSIGLILSSWLYQ